MAINFPDSPSNGDTHTANGVVYTYNSTSTLWDTISGGGGGSSVTVSDTAPASPSDGDQWFDSTDGSLSVYYNDGSSSQWISTSGPAGAAGVDGTNGTDGTDGASGSPTSYANLAAFPSSGNTAGNIGFAIDTKASYMWDGVAWQRMSIGNQLGPRYTTSPSATHDLNSDGTTTTLTAVAVDDSGFPVTYDWDAYSGSTVYSASSLPPQLTGVSESNGVFTLTPSTTESNAGDFSFRVKASDGVLTTPTTSTISLGFSVPVVVDVLQTRNSNTLQPTTDGTITTFHTNATSGGTGTLYFPTGSGNTMPTGKKYIEVKLTNATGDAWTVGIARTNDAAAHNANIGYNSTNSNQYNSQTQISFGYQSQFPSGAPGGTTTGFSGSPIIANNSNDVFQIAYDTDAEKVWFGVNNSWSQATGDPVTGAGRTIDYSQGGYSFIIGSETNGSISATFIFGGQVYAPPTGFSYY